MNINSSEIIKLALEAGIIDEFTERTTLSNVTYTLEEWYIRERRQMRREAILKRRRTPISERSASTRATKEYIEMIPVGDLVMGYSAQANELIVADRVKWEQRV